MQRLSLLLLGVTLYHALGLRLTPVTKQARLASSLSSGGLSPDSIDAEEVAVILLAGGKGKRMKSAVPKQFLPLLGKPVFLRSLDVFTTMKSIASIVL
jgi:UDP-N-acetylglucosamine pyrophosphorylase